MRNFLFCVLLVLISTSASASFISNTPVLRKKLASAPLVNSPLVRELYAFLISDDVLGFTHWLGREAIDVNTIVGEDNASLLHLLARRGKVLFVDRLLKAGADTEITERYGFTPLDEAEFWDHPAVIVRLRAAGAIPADIAAAQVEGQRGDTVPRQAARHAYRMREILPHYTPSINYLTVCGDWLLRCSAPILGRAAPLLLRDFKAKGRTRLHEAIAQRKTGMVKLLLLGRRYRHILYERDEHDWQAVHYAAFHGNIEELEMLRAKGADINAVVYPSEHTPLTLAALMGRTTTVQRLLEMGANAAARNHLDRDALQLAVLGMNIETVAVLLQHGLARETIEAARQLAVEKCSTRQGYQRLLELLDNAMPRSPAALNERGLNELQQAVWDLDMPRVEKILARHDKSLLHEPDRWGWTVAHHAAFLGYTDMMELLFSAGVDFGAVGPDGFTPILIAAERGESAAVAFLIRIDADTSVTTAEGQNLLHLAVEGGHVLLARYLVHKGAKLRLRTNAGESALDIAKRLGNQKIISILDVIEIGFYKNTAELYIGPADRD